MPKIMYEFSSVMLQNTQNNSHGPGRRIRGVHVVTYRRDMVQRSRADPEQCCWGGARTVGGVRARRREAPSSKCDRGSAKRLPKELRQGSGAQK